MTVYVWNNEVVQVILPSDYGRHKEAIERAFRNPNSDGELIGGKQTEHGGDGLLHGILGGIRNALGDNGSVERFDLLEHVGDNREFSIETGLSSGDEVVGDSAAVDTGDEAAGGGGGAAFLEGGGGEKGADEEVRRRGWLEGLEGEVDEARDQKGPCCGGHRKERSLA
ncbi:unnamed protein product [Camellia sinensis]